jgi:hypothetical protein
LADPAHRRRLGLVQRVYLDHCKAAQRQHNRGDGREKHDSPRGQVKTTDDHVSTFLYEKWGLPVWGIGLAA